MHNKRKEIILCLKKDPELFNHTAKAWAEYINSTNKTQLRGFYDKVLELETRLTKKNETFEDVYPFIQLLNSKVAYGVNRKVVSKGFQEMMTQTLKQIPQKDGLEVFKLFKLFFEAVLGFFKEKEKRLA